MQFSRQQQRWVLAAQSGDREALDRLLQSVQDALYGYLVQITQDRHLAEDVLQETFLSIFRKLYWLREPGAFPAWVYRIASRQAFRAMKRRRKIAASEVDEFHADGTREHADERIEQVERIPDLLSRLSPASRAVISLHYLHEMTLAETADVLAISPGTVKSRLAYGLTQLRRSVPANLNQTVSR